MRYTTIIAATGLAAGVSADGGQSWAVSSSSAPDATVSCTTEVTQTITTTAECAEVTSEIYSTTVTVDQPQTRTITVYPADETAQGLWQQWQSTSEPAVSTEAPQSCASHIVTETETAWIKKTGSTTTITKSTLLVKAGDSPTETITITATPAPAASWASGDFGLGGAGNYGHGFGGSHGSGSGGIGDLGDLVGDLVGDIVGDVVAPLIQTVAGGLKLPISEKIVKTDLLPWHLPAITNTKSYEAPQYTQRPDGSFGFQWGNWDGSNGDDGKNPGKDGPGHSGPGKDVPGANGPGQTGPFQNQTHTGYNITAGSPGSNVTKPILPLKEGYCNGPGRRNQWCDGKDANTNYYKNYFSGKTCRADLTLTWTKLNLDGDLKEVFAINGQVPGPLIECNWGDMMEITVRNQVPQNGTSFHWHGFRQLNTNNMDGVPGVTECPIAPGESKTYTFHASSYGTTWYHSHALSQYGDGAFGPIIIHGPATADYDADMGVVAIQDTFNGTAAQQNYIITHQGPKNTVNYLLNGHNVKHDLSAGQHTLWEVEHGKKYLFRFVNAAAQNMFSLSFDNHKMTVIAADFVPIVPYQTQWLNIGIGQRYDVVVEMNQAVNSYFLRAVTQTQCPSGCDNTGLGNANGIIAYKGVNTLPYYLPTSTTDKQLSDFAICDDEPLAKLVPHVKLGAGSSSAFAQSAGKMNASAPAGVQTVDDGVVFRWFLNNGAININFTQPTLKSLQEKTSLNSTLFSNPIVLKQKNQWVYWVIQNQFFAAHPIHLHGHDFSILGQGEGNFDPRTQLNQLNFDNPMRRDTAMLKGAPVGPPAPTGYTVIGFETDNPGAWLMHCHIIWHVDGGLAVQWIERPDDIDTANYYNNQFKHQCSAFATYAQQHPEVAKTSGSSGLKKREFHNQEFDVVRRSDYSAAKHYLEGHMKREFGDGHRRRRFGNRR